MSSAVVVGSGPNGLAAAVALAQQGVAVTVLEGSSAVGGGTQTAELTVPGLLHDVCSAIHPFGVASPYLSSLPLAEHGLRWAWPEVDLAHPLDDGTAAVLRRSLDETCEGLGADGDRWRRVFGPLAKGFDDLAPDVLGPIVGVPRHPLGMARFGLRAGLPATVLARAFSTEAARLLFLGNAAHAFRPLNRPATAAVGTMLVAAGHRHGWPVAVGGSRAITDALVSLLQSLGGVVETDALVRSRADLPPADVTLFDTTPSAFLRIVGDGPSAYRRFRHGPAAFKVDLAVRDGIPWTAPEARKAGSLHVGTDLVRAERDTVAGRLARRPFLLVGQQYLADPSRSVGDVHPVWVYAHVPHGYRGDVTELVLDQLERYAPGTRSRIVASHVMTPADLEAHNPNYVGGDIAGGSNSLPQLVARPVLSPHPYDTGVPGYFLCSASTPPGAGVHGMCGWHAAQRALRFLRIR